MGLNLPPQFSDQPKDQVSTSGGQGGELPEQLGLLIHSRLSPAEFDAAVARINELIDDAGAEIATAGWLPGNDWSGSPFQPLYEKAAGRNYELSGKFFGLLVWYTVKERPETWASGRYEVDGRDIGSRTYFRVVVP